MVVVHALKKFRVYLLGMQFKIVTDCKAITQKVNKADIPPRVARWAMLFQDYTFTIEHRSSNRMTHVYGLRRYPVMITFIANNRNFQAQKTDDRVRNIIKSLEKKSLQKSFL